MIGGARRAPQGGGSGTGRTPGRLMRRTSLQHNSIEHRERQNDWEK
jgi:hypothetical protein